MDNVKLYAKYYELEELVSTLKIFYDDILMQFGLNRGTELPVKKGSPVKSKEMIREINTEITELKHNKTFFFLGIDEANSIYHTIKKKK